jgi:hypothetical protein
MIARSSGWIISSTACRVGWKPAGSTRKCGTGRRPIRGAGGDVDCQEPIARRQSERAAVLAGAQALGLGLELGGAGRDALLELGVERLELAGLAVELDEHLDLGAQHLRHHRDGDVVDGADLVAAQVICVGDLHA